MAAKNLKIDHLITIDPITENQRIAHVDWKKHNYNLVLNGSAGTGKTFTALYLALEQVMDKGTPWNQVIIVRSVVPTREMGFLPGTIDEKLEPYISPYKDICDELFPDDSDVYDRLVDQGIIKFVSTSFVRGTTYNKSIILVDEMQNCNFHELDSIITRVGEDSRIIFCGDYYQSDFTKDKEREGILQFVQILQHLRNFSVIEFGWSDIVRSDLVRDYIMTKDMMKRGQLSVD